MTNRLQKTNVVYWVKHKDYWENFHLKVRRPSIVLIDKLFNLKKGDR